MGAVEKPSRPLFALGFATVCGIGYAPVAPGTFGSAAGLLLWSLLPQSAVVHGGLIVGVLIVGSWSAHVAERYFQTTDPGPVVIDEVMGMLVTLFLIPAGWAGALTGFFLFRVMDVVKPYPANRLERLPSGLGVMADDLMAAFYANIGLRATLALGNWIIS